VSGATALVAHKLAGAAQLPLEGVALDAGVVSEWSRLVVVVELFPFVTDIALDARIVPIRARGTSLAPAFCVVSAWLSMLEVAILPSAFAVEVVKTEPCCGSRPDVK
jgi:hypothetical protein